VSKKTYEPIWYNEFKEHVKDFNTWKSMEQIKNSNKYKIKTVRLSSEDTKISFGSTFPIVKTQNVNKILKTENME
jgi:hypothetical protein